MHCARVSEIKAKSCRHFPNSFFIQFGEFLVLSDSQNIGLRVVERVDSCRIELAKIPC